MKIKLPLLSFVVLCLSSFACKTTSDDYSPDVRHWGLDLASATPRLEHLEDFLSDLDLEGDVHELEEAHQERMKAIEALTSTDLSQASPGVVYNIKRRTALALLRESAYLRARAERRLYFETNQWRLTNPELLIAIKKDKDLEENSFKTLELTRELANKFTFDRDENQYLLIRLMARQQSTSLGLYADEFKKSYGASPFAPKVNALLAANAFDQKDFVKTEALLKELMENKTSDVRPYVAFQLAWVHISRSLVEKDTAKRAEYLSKGTVGLRLAIKLMDEDKGLKRPFDLKEEAAHDLAWILAEQNITGVEALKALKDNQADTHFREFQKYSAVKAIRSKKFPEAESLVKELQFEQEKTIDYPQYTFMLAELALAKSDYSGVQQRLKEIKDLIGKPEVPWYEEWKDDKALVQLVDAQIGNYIVSTALALKAKGEQEKDKVRDESFARSREFMKLYAEWYPKGEVLDDFRYQTALLEYHSGNLEKAIELMNAIAKDKTSKHKKTAIYDAMIITSEWDEKQPLPKLPEVGKAKKPVTLTKSKVALLEQMDAYLKDEPQAENAINLKYSIADTYHSFGYYDKSLPMLDALIAEAPKTEEGAAALRLQLDYFMEAARWDELIEKCKVYLKNKDLREAGHRKIIRQTLEYATSMAQQ